VKLEPWILRHRQRSMTQSTSDDKVLVFEAGDWLVDAGELRIRRVTRWQAPSRTRFGIYLANESGPTSDVHTRLGHERRWYIDYTEDTGRVLLRCMVNYQTKMVWDNTTKRLYDFEGRLYEFQARATDNESRSSEDDSDEDEDYDDGPLG
jgi:hypothetical protein